MNQTVCRLCLSNLNEAGEAVPLFEASSNNAETEIVTIIVKYLNFNFLPDDPISNKICQDCCRNLMDFHKFRMHVDRKQSTLQYEFLEVNCDEPISVPVSNEEELHCRENEECPLDSNKLSMECSALVKSEDENSTDDDDVPLISLKLNGNSKPLTAEHTEIWNQELNVDVTTADNKKPLSAASRTNTSILAASERNEDIIANFMTLHCDICKCSVESYGDLRAHFKSEHDHPPYIKCCGRKYDKTDKFVEHITWHQNPDNFKCNICGKKFHSKKYLQLHKITVHTPDEAAVICSICERGFRSRKCLENHMLRHTGKSILTCKICNKCFATPERLQRHVELVCSRQRRCGKCLKNHIAKHRSENDYHCEVCNKCFVTPQRQRRHISAIHENIFPHVCDTCGKKFKFKPSFEKHLLEHQGIVEPTVQCNLCGKWSKNKNSLRLHYFTHEQEIDIACHVCGRICATKSALRRHIYYMHKIPCNLQCNFCEKTFKIAKNLEEHMAIHTQIQLYSCPHCSKECRSKSNMYVHIKRVHVKEWMESRKERSNARKECESSQ